jgi:DNA-binding NtrC family response regulator
MRTGTISMADEGQREVQVSNLQVFVLGSDAPEDLFQGLVSGDGVDLRYVRSEADCQELLQGGNWKTSLLVLDTTSAAEPHWAAMKALQSKFPGLCIGIAGFDYRSAMLGNGAQACTDLFLRLPIQPHDVEGLLARLRVTRPHLVPSGLVSTVHIEEMGDGAFFLAASPAMRKIYEQVSTIAMTNVTVLITGESGSGKEVVTKLLHKKSTRSTRQLLKVNCAALPADLLESELFGYEAGAFTGAMKAKPGKFELCDKGTIMLDEIGEMSPQLQAKLLHVLQDGEFSRLGARSNTKVDVRVITATNIDMAKAVADKSFREDLFYRLNAFVIHVPPLRERPEEIPYFLNECARRIAVQNGLEPISFSTRLIAASTAYPWPGNLRELGNFVKRYLIMRDEAAAVTELESKTPKKWAAVVPLLAEEMVGDAAGLKGRVRAMKDQTETEMIREVLIETHWNRRIAAEKLQISYKALLYKIRQYELKATG